MYILFYFVSDSFRVIYMRTENFYAARTIKYNKYTILYMYIYLQVLYTSIYICMYYIFTQYNTHISNKTKTLKTRAKAQTKCCSDATMTSTTT